MLLTYRLHILAKLKLAGWYVKVNKQFFLQAANGRFQYVKLAPVKTTPFPRHAFGVDTGFSGSPNCLKWCLKNTSSSVKNRLTPLPNRMGRLCW